MRTLPIFLLFFSPLAPDRLPELPLKADHTVFDQRDMEAFDEKQKLVSAIHGKPAQALAIAKSFLGVPYVSGTLEQGSTEQLVVNLRQLDCWTFIENSLAIALSDQGDFQDYQTQLQKLRYWVWIAHSLFLRLGTAGPGDGLLTGHYHRAGGNSLP